MTRRILLEEMTTEPLPICRRTKVLCMSTIGIVFVRKEIPCNSEAIALRELSQQGVLYVIPNISNVSVLHYKSPVSSKYMNGDQIRRRAGCWSCFRHMRLQFELEDCRCARYRTLARRWPDTRHFLQLFSRQDLAHIWPFSIKPHFVVQSPSTDWHSHLPTRDVTVQSAMPYSFSALDQEPFIGDLNQSSVLADNNESGVVEKGGGIVLVRPTPTQAIADLVEVFRSS